MFKKLITPILWFFKNLKKDLDSIPYKEKKAHRHTKTGDKWAKLHYKDRPVNLKRKSHVGLKTFFIKRKNVLDFDREIKRVAPGSCVYHYDQKVGLQLVARYDRGRSFVAHDRGKRDDNLRRTVKTWVKPAEEQHDRTHTQPWGFHGFEDDPVLVVGWSSKQNRNELAEFERRINKINKETAIIWVTWIKPTRYGACWIYEVYDGRGREIDKLTLYDGSRYYPKKFYWLKDKEDGFIKK